jgi:hypothetical protein
MVGHFTINWTIQLPHVPLYIHGLFSLPPTIQKPNGKKSKPNNGHDGVLNESLTMTMENSYQ